MAEAGENVFLLTRALWKHYRRVRIQRRLSFGEDHGTLPRIHRDGTRENPVVVEDSDEESSPRDMSWESDAEYALLFERVHNFVRDSFEHKQEDILLLLTTFLRRLDSNNQKIGMLQGLSEYLLWGETDEEAEDTDGDED